MAKRDQRLSLICFLLGFFFFGANSLAADVEGRPEENEVLAIGTGAVVSGNLARAKGGAISHALVKGVENYLLRRLGSQGVANNFQRLIQEIVPKAKEKVENFHILAEEQIGDEYKVLLRIRINEKVIDEKLREAGLVLTEGLPIKVLFLVSETKDDTVFYWWKDPEVYSAISSTELVLHNVFQERGFSPINRRLGAPEIEYSEELRSIDLQEADVLRWGKLFSADVVIYGQSKIVHEKEVSLTLKALDVNQGVQICQGIHVEPVDKGLEGQEPIIETLGRVVIHLVSRLTPTIILFTAPDRKKVSQLEVTLRGLSNYKQFRVFRDFLRRDVKGVTSVRQTRIRRDSISIAVEFQGDRGTFLARVLNHENVPLALKLEKTEEGEIIFNAR